jgi:hypothetical protein
MTTRSRSKGVKKLWEFLGNMVVTREYYLMLILVMYVCLIFRLPFVICLFYSHTYNAWLMLLLLLSKK